MSEIITIFGATGNQGKSVLKQILAHPVLNKTYKIRAVTRDPTKASAKALLELSKDAGKIELVSVSLFGGARDRRADGVQMGSR